MWRSSLRRPLQGLPFTPTEPWNASTSDQESWYVCIDMHDSVPSLHPCLCVCVRAPQYTLELPWAADKAHTHTHTPCPI